MLSQEVVVSGVGMFSPFGSGEKAFVNGDLSAENASGTLCPLNPEDHGVSGELAENGWRASLLAIAASRSALGEKLSTDSGLRQATGVIIGTSLFNIGLFHSFLNNFGCSGPSAIPPWALHYSLPLAHASHVAVTLGLNRMCETITDPFTAGISALGMGYRAISQGEERSLLAGGVESPSGGFLLDYLAEILTGHAQQPPVEGCAIFHLQSAAGRFGRPSDEQNSLAYIRGYTVAFTGGDLRRKETMLASFAKECFPDQEGIDLHIDAAGLPNPLTRTLTAGPALACALAVSRLEKQKPNLSQEKCKHLPFYRRGNDVDRIIVTAENSKGDLIALALQSKRESDAAAKKIYPTPHPCSGNKEKAVITGMGVIASIGVGQKAFSKALLSAESGVISYIPPGLDQAGPSTAAPVRDLAPILNIQRSAQLSSVAAKEALIDAGLVRVLPASGKSASNGVEDYSLTESNRVGLYLAETLSSAEVWIAIGEDVRDSRLELGSEALNAALKNINNTTSLSLIRQFRLRGETVTFASGCSGGLFALGRAARDCLHTAKPIILAGGVDSALFSFAFGILSQAQLLTICPDPSEAGRPFDQARDGEVTGEGSAMFIVESLESSVKRGAKPYAYVSGFGAAGDGHHFKYNKPDGEALYQAMQEALTQADLKADAIDLVIAHASGFQGSDSIEVRALARLLSGVNPLPPVVSIKGATGQPFSAGAPLQVAAALCAFRENMIPPTAHFSLGDAEDPFDHVPVARKSKTALRHILITSYGYGGGKAAMVLSAYGDK